MTPDQCKAARKLLGWSRDRLGGMCHVPIKVIEIYERTGRVVADPLKQSGAERLAAVESTLEQAGVVFTSGDEFGVRLRSTDA